MKETLRKIAALSLAVVLLAPNLAWSQVIGESGGGVSADGAVGAGASIGAGVLPQDGVLQIPDGAVNFDVLTTQGNVSDVGIIRELAGAEKLVPEVSRTIQAPQEQQGRAPQALAVQQPAHIGIIQTAAERAVAAASGAVNPFAVAQHATGDDQNSVLSGQQSQRPTALAALEEATQELGQESSNPALALKHLYTGLTATAGGAGSSESGNPAEGGVGQESRRLHQQYEANSKQRLDAFQKKVEQFKAGVFGAKLIIGQGQFGIAATLNGKPTPSNVIQKMVDEGRVPGPKDVSQETHRANWEQTKKKVQEEFAPELNQLLQADQLEHKMVHEQMAQIEKATAMRQAQEHAAIIQDLEKWGVPNRISVDMGERTGLRYSVLYRMNGTPTDLGTALHDILAPLIAQDPTVLSRITRNQLHDTIKLLARGQKFVLDPSSEDFQKLRRMGITSEGYSYPKDRLAYIDKAREALLAAPEPGDAPFGLGLRPESKQPVRVLSNIYEETLEQINTALQQGASVEDIAGKRDFILALSGALGLTIPMPGGKMAMVPVQHSQLPIILAELDKRGAAEEVIKAVIRSFPLGESIYRMGVHKLWAKGLTGKGVKVAVIDNGVDFDHPDFKGVKSLSENLTRDNGWFAKGNHATPMASIIHALAPEAEIQSYQSISNTELPGVLLTQREMYDATLKALDRARANGAQVISMSMGFPMGYANDPLTEKIAELAKEGILVVVSAGNEGGDLPSGFQLRTPGTAPDAITVGAVDYHGKKAPFSSSGMSTNTENHTLQDKPDIYAFGVNVKAALRLPKEIYREELIPYNDVSGTSPAAPHVSGLAALMVQAAQEAGAQVNGTQAVPAAKQALRAAAVIVNRLPVMQSAEKAVQEFVRILSGGGGSSSGGGLAARAKGFLVGTRGKQRPK